ncbi:phytanoyl-CoA dioxygenase [Rhizobium laguerreae]|jgi:ectoine hydroxylase-related dioxygenase (phytanoyl-CoA dioxygenase family)|uniref:Ectoine hydroxylase-related dioxygenase (Phytanoyl-CoA dioxygenase family) n=1 Tax=Rhizobium laguerreae TaxID=1076926 RepID=A0ABR6GFB1_9HYPH|nr:phytanoyl-CoA dioxygenase family protein [Rhizobium laguerreae]MBB3164970.1 ectoine hydroxylase-related dioxygenase (phytanoyl-CoA dioxygenase family) [Rhizobium laguerreae]MBN9987324.1 phytanoyl-CoA dioxygenase family protein [Rhizobium laguerreae]MBY3073587.1 phytanoyl-CoA dioxygenase [Rhizobium laguerreae]MBY3093960.1 phytanoyl-CoA dioxygenase [Rhizobium laguerreae]MBY3098969.1 phytanoyl-CoA dioxygenase [Rhizobium laguerreae]
MKTDNQQKLRADRVWLSEDACDLDEFRALAEKTTALTDYPSASAVEKNVLIYDSRKVMTAAATPEGRRAVLAEICDAFGEGPGVVVFKRASEDTGIIDRASTIFDAIIEEQHRTSTGGGDHFAKPGANDRIWNSLEKHCLADPTNFAEYYGNTIVALASEAWLGPSYQMTAQVNRVNPGGSAQSAHRDYHLGFQSSKVIEQFPAHVHRLSPVLTLQGAVAHCDMPLESGPTLFLPYSQTYVPGYLALKRQEFRDYFETNHVQLPLEKGDVVFFNPALFHAAGTNRSADIKRVANLLQVSSAFGRAMETVNRERMTARLFPALKALQGRLSPDEIANAVAACAEGYSFPTNLDRDPPLGGLAPKTQAQLMHEALKEGWSDAAFTAALAEQAGKKLS